MVMPRPLAAPRRGPPTMTHNGLWRPAGIATLLTDFGLADPYVGIMKGVLHREAPGLRAVVDLSHDVPPQDVAAAAFFLEASWPWFPVGTVHVVVVDPEVGTERALLVAARGGHAFVAPDNGILAPLVERHQDARVLKVDPARAPVVGGSATFHGRDRIAPLAARLCEGLPPSALGEPWDGHRRLPEARLERGADGSLRAQVVWVDRFGNLITSAARSDLVARGREPGGDAWRCEVAGRELPLSRAYADVEGGELVCLVDSYERVEVAVRDGSAAEALGLGPGAELVLRRQPEDTA